MYFKAVFTVNETRVCSKGSWARVPSGAALVVFMNSPGKRDFIQPCCQPDTICRELHGILGTLKFGSLPAFNKEFHASNVMLEAGGGVIKFVMIEVKSSIKLITPPR